MADGNFHSGSVLLLRVSGSSPPPPCAQLRHAATVGKCTTITHPPRTFIRVVSATFDGFVPHIFALLSRVSCSCETTETDAGRSASRGRGSASGRGFESLMARVYGKPPAGCYLLPGFDTRSPPKRSACGCFQVCLSRLMELSDKAGCSPPTPVLHHPGWSVVPLDPNLSEFFSLKNSNPNP